MASTSTSRKWLIPAILLLAIGLTAAASAQEETPAESTSEAPTGQADETPSVATGAAESVSTRHLVDGIAAVVGDEIILESEVDEEYYIYQMRTGSSSLSQEAAEQIRSQIVREMVNEMLLVAMAHRDTIELPPGALEEEMDARVAELVNRHGSEEALDAALAQEGLTLPELKVLYESEIERRLLAERVVRQEIHANISVTWGEVERYYSEHTDEVGEMPEAFHIAGILVTPKVREEAKEAAIAKLTEAADKIAAGEPFEDVAAEYSDDPSGATGGDLGTFGRGVMVPEFEDAVFAMEVGEVSGVISTRFGFHIVEVLEKDESTVRARHILARVAPGPDDELRARATADSLRQRTVDGEDFAELAGRRSDDPASRMSGGEIGWFSIDDISPAFKSVVEGLSPGEIGEVATGESGFYVLKLLDHQEARTATLDEVRENLKDYLFSLKAEEAYNELIARLSREIFVDIRTGMVSAE